MPVTILVRGAYGYMGNVADPPLGILRMTKTYGLHWRRQDRLTSKRWTMPHEVHHLNSCERGGTLYEFLVIEGFEVSARHFPFVSPQPTTSNIVPADGTGS